MSLKVYVAGPYTLGDVALNVRNAISAAETLLNMGLVPFVPHMTHFWHMIFPHHYQAWLDYDNQWLPLCDVVLRLSGESSGADAEVVLATSLGKPVFRSMRELVAWLEGQPS